MRIEQVEVDARRIALAEPYTIATETVSHVDNVFVRIVTTGPHVGLGCASPTPTVTGETLEACLDALDCASQGLRGENALSRARLLDSLTPILAGCPAASAALDMALWDLLGKVAELGVWQLLGGFRRAIPTSVTVCIDDVDAMVERARAWCAEGFDILKLKGGLDPDADIAVVRRVREAVGPDVVLRFDANQGYTVEQAARFLQGVAEAGLELLEQPTPRGQGAALHRVTQAAPMPVMADESLLDLADALRLAKGGIVDLLNIKLQTVGGIDAALAVNAVGRSAGFEVMVGCMDESALAIAAGLHFALGRPNVAYADLDGHLDLLEDPGRGAVILEEGHLRPVPHPGLGLRDLGSAPPRR